MYDGFIDKILQSEYDWKRNFDDRFIKKINKYTNKNTNNKQ